MFWFYFLSLLSVLLKFSSYNDVKEEPSLWPVRTTVRGISLKMSWEGLNRSTKHFIVSLRSSTSGLGSGSIRIQVKLRSWKVTAKTHPLPKGHTNFSCHLLLVGGQQDWVSHLLPTITQNINPRGEEDFNQRKQNIPEKIKNKNWGKFASCRHESAPKVMIRRARRSKCAVSVSNVYLFPISAAHYHPINNGALARFCMGILRTHGVHLWASRIWG